MSDQEIFDQEVEIRIVDVRFPKGNPNQLGLVDAALIISGIEIIICNLSVVRNKSKIMIIPPMYRDHMGVKQDVLKVPPTINEMMAEMILDIFIEVENGQPQIH